MKHYEIKLDTGKWVTAYPEMIYAIEEFLAEVHENGERMEPGDKVYINSGIAADGQRVWAVSDCEHGTECPWGPELMHPESWWDEAWDEKTDIEREA